MKSYYGSEGVDTTTGLGRADLMCLLDSGSDTGLVEDPRSVIDCSFKDDYPHPENREVSRLRISHCEGDVVSPLPVKMSLRKQETELLMSLGLIPVT